MSFVISRAWIQAVRDALVANEYVDGVHIGKLYFTGLPQEQMDGAHDTFEALPKLVGATLCIVGAVLLVSFRSLLVPIRAALLRHLSHGERSRVLGPWRFST